MEKNGDRVTSNKCKHLLVKNEIKKLKALDLSYFWGKNYFEGDDGTQNSLVFQVKEKYFEDEYDSRSYSIKTWKSKGLSSQSLSISGIVGTIKDIKMSKPIRPAYVIFNRKKSFFQQKKVINSRSIVNIYIVYSVSLKTISSNNALKNCLFGATEVTKPNDTTDLHEYIYSGYDIGFDRTSQFTHPDGGMYIQGMVLGLIAPVNLHILMVEWVEIW